MSGPNSGSLDDIFLCTSASTPNFHPDRKRRSAYTEAFIETITAPVAERRISVPLSDPYQKCSSGNTSVDQVFEENVPPGALIMSPVSVDSTLPMSYSADDLTQLQEDADAVGPSKWKKFGIAAG